MANFFEDNPSLLFQLDHPLMQRIVELKENHFSGENREAYAPQDYADALENYRQVLGIVGEICGDVLAANAERVDAEGPTVVDGRVHYHPGTQQNHDALAQAGLYGMSLPREFGGLNFPMVPYVMAAELVSRADGGFANIWGLQDCAETINEFASDEQRRQYLPLANQGKTFAMGLTEPDAGSDLQAVMLKAHYDEKRGTWLLNGVKRFITNGDADVSLVMARSEEGTTDARGISLFLYDNKKTDCVRVRRIEHKMGIIGSPTCELVFKDAPAELVGERKLGLIKYVMSLMNGARLGVAAQSVGIAEAATREAEKYANEREQFGKLIKNIPAVREMLVMMRAKTDAIRALLYETTRYVDIYKSLLHIQRERTLTKEERNELKEYTRLAEMFTPLAKLFGSEFCNQVTYDAVQVHGGTGYMRDFPVERLYRDARITNIYEGTSQLQVVAAIRSVMTGQLTQRLTFFAQQVKGEAFAAEAKLLAALTEELTQSIERVQKAENPNYIDFHARRLVEIGGFIAIAYLLILDSERCTCEKNCFEQSARRFVRYAEVQVRERVMLINSISLEAYLADYDVETPEA
ncbi:MAG: acyl-CoA dehydrogenase family protein [Bacteroides sp.]